MIISTIILKELENEEINRTTNITTQIHKMSEIYDNNSTFAKFDIIVAYDAHDGGIGRAGELPWSIPQDLARFRNITTSTIDKMKKNIVIMGRRTYESLPFIAGLPRRINIVLTHAPHLCKDSNTGPMTCPSLHSALMLAHHLVENNVAENTFVIGGQCVYNDALLHPGLKSVRATVVQTGSQREPYDAFFPVHHLEHMQVDGMSDWVQNNDLQFRYMTFKNI